MSLDYWASEARDAATDLGESIRGMVPTATSVVGRSDRDSEIAGLLGGGGIGAGLGALLGSGSMAGHGVGGRLLGAGVGGALGAGAGAGLGGVSTLVGSNIGPRNILERSTMELPAAGAAGGALVGSGLGLGMARGSRLLPILGSVGKGIALGALGGGAAGALGEYAQDKLSHVKTATHDLCLRLAGMP